MCLWKKMKSKNKAENFPLTFISFYKFRGNNVERFRNFILTNDIMNDDFQSLNSQVKCT